MAGTFDYARSTSGIDGVFCGCPSSITYRRNRLIIRKTTTALALSLALAIPMAAQKTAKRAEKQAPAEKDSAWFATYDTTRHGQLTVQEFRPGRTLFAALDVAANAAVTTDGAIEALTPKEDKEPTVDLKKLDTDGDGYVTR